MSIASVKKNNVPPPPLPKKTQNNRFIQFIERHQEMIKTISTLGTAALCTGITLYNTQPSPLVPPCTCPSLESIKQHLSSDIHALRMTDYFMIAFFVLFGSACASITYDDINSKRLRL